MFEYIRFKKTFKLVMAGIIASTIAGNIRTSDKIARADSKPKVVASHSVICDLLNAIAEETIELTCLLEGDRDPHTYRPTPSDRKALEQAQLIFYGGYNLEPQIVESLADLETPQVALYEQVVTEPIMAEHDHGHGGEHGEGEHDDHEHEGEHDDHEHEGEHDDHEHEGEHDDHEHEADKTSKSELEPDPHVWHNVENTVKMVEVIRSAFLQANPDAAEQYLLNSVTLTERLWQLDAWIKDQIATIPENQKVLVTTHNSLNYYVTAYNLDDYLALQGLSAESSPTASQVRELSEQIKATEVPTIFAESTKSDRVLRNVAKAADVELAEQPIYADTLGPSENYIDMMSHNTCTIVDGLGGECEPFQTVSNR